MRTLAAAALALTLCAAPAQAGGTPDALTLPSGAPRGPSATLLEGRPGAGAPHGLLVGALDVRGLADLGSGASGDGGRREPAVALLLGFIPGFGLGHWYAGDPNYLTWTIIDVVFIVAAIVITASVHMGGLIWLGWVVEHAIQGYLAYELAIGRGRSSPRLAAPDVVSPVRGGFSGAERLLVFAF
jgi:hypothetical protein